MYVDTDHPDYAKLKRYTIAYGGDLEMDQEDADYVVDIDRKPDNAKSVSAEWLFECIKAERLVSIF